MTRNRDLIITDLMAQAQTVLETPVGKVFLVASSTGLQSVQFRQTEGVKLLNAADPVGPEHKVLNQAKRELAEYFQGRRKSFEVELDYSATQFQKMVWLQLRKIPYGQTCAYKDVALAIRKPKAFRAVGTANSRNPFCILVPCHRVVGADGKLGGYSAGLKIKSQLLALEKQWKDRS